LPTELAKTVTSDKGFDTIIPELDMAKLPRRNLKFGQKEVLDNNIVVDKVKSGTMEPASSS
jgi:hypothetical protein